MNTLVVILVGCLVATACALVGSFLVLRKLSLLGDAISHAVLPGIAIAFLLTGSRAAIPMVLGAAALGLVTVFLVELFQRSGLMYEDASIGVVFPALFAIGVILISRYAHMIDLDLACVLYGEIIYTPLDVVVLGGRSYGPKALWVTGTVAILDLLLVVLFYKELKVTTFDPDLAASIGIPTVLIHYVLMGAVSVTVVGAFESVGAILVVAMLIVPPAAAYLLTDRLAAMIAIAVGLGLASAVLGYAFSRWLDCSVAGAMATTAGLLFALAFLGVLRPVALLVAGGMGLVGGLHFAGVELGPDQMDRALAGSFLALAPVLAAVAWGSTSEHGLLARWTSHRRMARSLSGQLLLLHLEDRPDPFPVEQVTARFGWGRSRVEWILDHLTGEGLVTREEEGLRITDEGSRVLEQVGTRPLAHPS